MRATILDGSAKGDIVAGRVSAALVNRLATLGWSVETIVLREKTIGACAGDFDCWVRTPGVCRVADDNLSIAEAVARSDLLVCLTPVTFGGCSSTLKRMVDHLIQNISPFFMDIDGETHHEKRYDANPDLLAVGWLDEPDAEAETVFHHLIQRNAINLHAGTRVSAVVSAGASDAELVTRVHEWLDDAVGGRSTTPVALATQSSGALRPIEVRHALLLVGSPRTRSSTSNSIGCYLNERLATRSIDTETLFPHQAMRSSAKTQRLLDAVDDADLVTLAFPLHVDSLPAPVIEMLEAIAARRGDHEHRPTLFAAIANSGLPESHQSLTALAICRLFARHAGFEWAGSLALGAGAVLVDGKPLTEERHAQIREALDLAGEALSRGQPIPGAARDLMGEQIVPSRALRILGKRHWTNQAKQHGTVGSLARQPYPPST